MLLNYLVKPVKALHMFLEAHATRYGVTKGGIVNAQILIIIAHAAHPDCLFTTDLALVLTVPLLPRASCD